MPAQHAMATANMPADSNGAAATLSPSPEVDVTTMQPHHAKAHAHAAGTTRATARPWVVPRSRRHRSVTETADSVTVGATRAIATKTASAARPAAPGNAVGLATFGKSSRAVPKTVPNSRQST